MDYGDGINDRSEWKVFAGMNEEWDEKEKEEGCKLNVEKNMEVGWKAIEMCKTGEKGRESER